MKTGIIFALVFIALVYGKDDASRVKVGQSNRQVGLRPGNPTPTAPKSSTRKKVCESGDTMMKDCNKCTCIAGGYGWRCTRKLCEPSTRFSNQKPKNGTSRRPHRKDRLRRIKREDDTPLICTPNETFKMGCEDCLCSPDGRESLCTMFGCIEF